MAFRTALVLSTVLLATLAGGGACAADRLASGEVVRIDAPVDGDLAPRRATW